LKFFDASRTRGTAIGEVVIAAVTLGAVLIADAVAGPL